MPFLATLTSEGAKSVQICNQGSIQKEGKVQKAAAADQQNVACRLACCGAEIEEMEFAPKRAKRK
jgi:hypothetical protein